MSPDPALLSKLRIQESAPFSVSGVDFTGPLYIRTESGEVKGYICLFTCAVTRAAHLEVVRRSFLQAFRHCASRKSVPHYVISDNDLPGCRRRAQTTVSLTVSEGNIE